MALIFNLTCVNHDNIKIDMIFPTSKMVGRSDVGKICESFGQVLRITREIGAKLNNIELSDQCSCLVRDKEMGVIVEMNGPQVNFPWHAAAVILSLQLAYFDVVGDKLPSRIYVDAILTPQDVEKWKSIIENKMFS